MDWGKAFQPERKVDWADIAEAIRDKVTMDEVIPIYAPELRTRNRRCPCPFHNGKDLNFSYTRSGYKCFVCGASGDVVAFVKDILGYATRADAMKRINQDLGLNLPIGTDVNAKISAEIAMRRAKHEAQDRAHQAWEAEYNRLLDEWISLDSIRRTADPDSDEYADAVKRIDYVSYQLDCMPREPR